MKLSKIVVCLLVYSFLLIHLSKGQNSIQEQIASSLLWKIEGKNIPNASYLFGTIHLIPKDSFMILPELEAAIKKVDKLILEVEMDTASLFASAMDMILPPTQTLNHLLDSVEFEYLTSFMKDSIPFPVPMYHMIKPIFLTQQIATSYCIDGEQMVYELYLNSKFKALKKPVSGLETAHEQLSWLNEIPLEEQAAMLMETVRNPRLACDEFMKMVKLYRKQDLSKLLKLTEEEKEMKNYTSMLLDNRNANWIDQIVSQAESQSLLVAVGAAHLAGEKGVISLLRKKGYTLTPVF